MHVNKISVSADTCTIYSLTAKYSSMLRFSSVDTYQDFVTVQSGLTPRKGHYSPRPKPYRGHMRLQC